MTTVSLSTMCRDRHCNGISAVNEIAMDSHRKSCRSYSFRYLELKLWPHSYVEWTARVTRKNAALFAHRNIFPGAEVPAQKSQAITWQPVTVLFFQQILSVDEFDRAIDKVWSAHSFRVTTVCCWFLAPLWGFHDGIHNIGELLEDQASASSKTCITIPKDSAPLRAIFQNPYSAKQDTPTRIRENLQKNTDSLPYWTNEETFIIVGV